MKIYFTIFLAFIFLTARSQQDTAGSVRHAAQTEYKRHSTIATISLGFFDYYRYYYGVPKGFTKGNTSGFTPIYAKLEHGLYKNISVGVTFCYDAFLYNYKQNYSGNNGPFTRYRTNSTRIFNGGVSAFYHLGRVLPVKHLDPFVGLGISLTNIRYASYPQGDSTLIKIDHTVVPYIKAGARYYISSSYSLFADLGYDQQSIFSIGFSCRFQGKKK